MRSTNTLSRVLTLSFVAVSLPALAVEESDETEGNTWENQPEVEMCLYGDLCMGDEDDGYDPDSCEALGIQEYCPTDDGGYPGGFGDDPNGYIAGQSAACTQCWDQYFEELSVRYRDCIDNGYPLDPVHDLEHCALGTQSGDSCLPPDLACDQGMGVWGQAGGWLGPVFDASCFTSGFYPSQGSQTCREQHAECVADWNAALAGQVGAGLRQDCNSVAANQMPLAASNCLLLCDRPLIHPDEQVMPGVQLDQMSPEYGQDLLEEWNYGGDFGVSFWP